MGAVIIENEAWRNEEGIYADRREAGRVLAEALKPHIALDALLLAIPSGGVPVGLEIARRLGIPFDLIVIRKINIPGNTEAGFGAVSLEGDVILDDYYVKALGLGKEEIDKIVRTVSKGLAERNHIFREDRPFPSVAGKTVILVDDGIAAGFTMTAAAKLMRRKNPSKIIIAVPTASARAVENIAPLVDAIVCPNIRHGYSFAVASAYREWHDLSQSEVLALLKTAPPAK